MCVVSLFFLCFFIGFAPSTGIRSVRLGVSSLMARGPRSTAVLNRMQHHATPWPSQSTPRRVPCASVL